MSLVIFLHDGQVQQLYSVRKILVQPKWLTAELTLSLPQFMNVYV